MQHDLPALGAAVITHWGWNRYRVRLCVMAVQHTFGGHLNYNPHLHMMVSARGMKTSVARWTPALEYDEGEIMRLWRFAVTAYLARANQNRSRATWTPSHDLGRLIQSQAKRKWNVHITPRMSKKHFLAYAGRYIRRLPISQRRILEVTPDQVVYQSKDTRTQTFVEARRKPEDLVAMLSVHVLERYQHSMRYFGLLAPRTKAQPSMLCFLSWARRNDKDPQGRVGSNHCRSDSELIRSWIPLDNVCAGPDIALLAPMPMDRSQVLRRIYCE
jgi:hypothetical protein